MGGTYLSLNLTHRAEKFTCLYEPESKVQAQPEITKESNPQWESPFLDSGLTLKFHGPPTL